MPFFKEDLQFSFLFTLSVAYSIKKKPRQRTMKSAVMVGSVQVALLRHVELCFLWLIEALRRLILRSELEEIICARDNVESDDKHSLVFPWLHLNSARCQLWNCSAARYIIMLHSFVFIIASKGIWSCSGHFRRYGGLENKCDSGVTLGLYKQWGICGLIKS